MKNLLLLLLLIVVAPSIAMNKRPASPEILVPGTPPGVYAEPEQASSESEYVVPGSPEEFEAARLYAEINAEVARRHREAALKQLRAEEQQKSKAQELAKKKAAAECKRQSKKPKKDS